MMTDHCYYTLFERCDAPVRFVVQRFDTRVRSCEHHVRNALEYVDRVSPGRLTVQVVDKDRP